MTRSRFVFAISRFVPASVQKRRRIPTRTHRRCDSDVMHTRDSSVDHRSVLGFDETSMTRASVDGIPIMEILGRRKDVTPRSFYGF